MFSAETLVYYDKIIMGGNLMSQLEMNTQIRRKSKGQEGIQRFGRFLSGMVMPNIGAFIAWGLITALFIPTGWTPNENLAALVGPMITYLLPLLIGYTGGSMAYGVRGGVIGAISTMGVIIGSDITMFLGAMIMGPLGGYAIKKFDELVDGKIHAMIMGPLGGYAIKKFDELVDGKIHAGFEMLVNNFSAGIIGAAISILAYLFVGPVVLSLNKALMAGVNAIVNARLLPLTSIFIEPGKILFLNNAINHGILGPLGVQEAKEAGKSIFFLLETNPGPGLGVLLAYWAFAKGAIKQSAPGAIIIHFLGGIHEIYFPYVLMNPILLLAVIAGGASGILIFTIFKAGLVATPSPGSIIALIAMTPKGSLVGVLLGVLVSTAVSFFIASYFIKRSRNNLNEEDFEGAKYMVKDFKAAPIKKSTKKVIFACDAGMGSSAMGATTLKNKFKKAGLDIEVVHCAVDEIPKDSEIVIVHESLLDRAKAISPNAEHIGIKNFMDDPEYDLLIKRLS